MKIHFAESEHDNKISPEFIKQYKKEIEKAYKEVTKLLPFGSRHINFFVQPRTFNIIESTSDNARTLNSEFIELAFDPTLSKKGLNRILNGVHYSVYHEMNHAARFNISIWHETFLDHCVFEGLATVFTRNFTSENASWAKYPQNVKEWLKEVIDIGDQANYDHYMYDHPDGRKTIGYKVGTYIIDQAMKNSGKSILDLSKMVCKDILGHARLKG